MAIFTLFHCTASRAMPEPIVGRFHADQKVLPLNNTGTGFTLPLYFGDPVQRSQTDTFIIDTTYTDIIVATTEC